MRIKVRIVVIRLISKRTKIGRERKRGSYVVSFEQNYECKSETYSNIGLICTAVSNQFGIVVCSMRR